MNPWRDLVSHSGVVGVTELDRNGIVRAVDRVLVARGVRVGSHLAEVVAGAQQPVFLKKIEQARGDGWRHATFSCFPDATGSVSDYDVWFRSSNDGDEVWAAFAPAVTGEDRLSARLLAMNDELVSTQRDLERERERLETLLEELRSSQLYIRKLEGILPICSRCHQVREDDDASWVPMADYIRTHSDVRLSHGYCPTCVEIELSALDVADDDPLAGAI